MCLSIQTIIFPYSNLFFIFGRNCPLICLIHISLSFFFFFLGVEPSTQLQMQRGKQIVGAGTTKITTNCHVHFDTCTTLYTCQTVCHVHFDTRQTRVRCGSLTRVPQYTCQNGLTRVSQYTCQTKFF
jgi:hypothetical protein